MKLTMFSPYWNKTLRSECRACSAPAGPRWTSRVLSRVKPEMLAKRHVAERTHDRHHVAAQSALAQVVEESDDARHVYRRRLLSSWR